MKSVDVFSNIRDVESADFWKKVDDAIEQQKLDEFRKDEADEAC